MTGEKPTLDDDLLSRLCDFVSSRMALRFRRERWGEMADKVGAAASELGHTDAAAFVERLLASPPSRAQIETLACHLTIGETYFWREPATFAALEALVLPEVIRAREKGERRVRIWSAGCATGEEPYSIAIAICRALPAREDWNISILATDINPRMLRRAAAGVYGAWSFRDVPRWLEERYFTRRADKKRVLSPRIRRMVTFAYLNLAEDSYPSALNGTNAMDVVFCRNVLMYFAPERVLEVGRKLFRCLAPAGWLVVGASELSPDLFPQFEAVRSHGAVLYRRDHGELPLQEPGPLEETASLRVAPWLAPADFLPAASPIAIPTVADSPDPEARAEGSASPAAGGTRPGAAEVRALANRGLLAEALAAGESAIAADKVDPGLQYLVALILQELDRREEAAAGFRRALYLDQDFVLAHFSLGNLLVRLKKAKAARKSFENVMTLLDGRGENELLPESDGLTAGRLREIVRATLEAGDLAGGPAARVNS